MAKKKKKKDTPKHKRLNRQSRIQSARLWIPKYEGKNLVHGYSKHFAVNKFCAVSELGFLGYTFKETYKQKLKDSEIQKQRDAEKRKEAKKKQQKDDLFFDSDETFAHIAGYTAGGVPYGFTWEEEGTMQELFDSNNNENQENGKNSAKIDVHDENLPF
ncbi:hypothetical protein [Paucisalibacillus globulus]|uniref:hypothetical protein n=1 Tax=Paucisalibacillus globulus TaxID=351095 RepID=UPI000BB884B2|nr:hypothetical protein [Paucisalibacillus globulus]